MIIKVDTREKPRAIVKILAEFDRQGISHLHGEALNVGDYMRTDNPYISIDRKQNLNELCNNVCQESARFKRELKRAVDNGIKLIVLVEHSEDIKTLDDVRSWVNPRQETSRYCVSGEQLHKTLTMLNCSYGVEFQFCSKNETGRRIIQILEEAGEIINA